MSHGGVLPVRTPGRSLKPPALETLQIRIESYGTDTDFNSLFDQFVLSEGPPLKHLSLRSIATPIGLPSLIQPHHPNSLSKIRTPLSSSQRLEVLDIQNRGNGIGKRHWGSPSKRARCSAASEKTSSFNGAKRIRRSYARFSLHPFMLPRGGEG